MFTLPLGERVLHGDTGPLWIHSPVPLSWLPHTQQVLLDTQDQGAAAQPTWLTLTKEHRRSSPWPLPQPALTFCLSRS